MPQLQPQFWGLRRNLTIMKTIKGTLKYYLLHDFEFRIDIRSEIPDASSVNQDFG